MNQLTVQMISQVSGGIHTSCGQMLAQTHRRRRQFSFPPATIATIDIIYWHRGSGTANKVRLNKTTVSPEVTHFYVRPVSKDKFEGYFCWMIKIRPYVTNKQQGHFVHIQTQ